MEGGGDGWFQEEVRWKLGRGDKVRFWEDVWIGDSSLKSLLHRLFSLSVNQEQKVEDVGEWEGTDWRWRLEWRRDRFEWETELEGNLLDYILRANVNKNISDIRVWGEEELEKYSVNIAYNHLAKRPGATHHYAFEYLWKAKAFPNVLMTAWRALLNRIPTMENLSRRGVQMNSVVCVLCQEKEDSCHHLFIECKYAQQVWSLCLKWLGLLSVQHNDLREHFGSFHIAQASSKQNLVLKGVWAAIVRCIWNQRNSILFKQEVVDAEEILQMVQFKSWLWMKYRESSLNYSFADWMFNLTTCIYSIS